MINLYSKTVCPKCVLVKGILDSNDIQFNNINIDHDGAAKEKLKELGFMSVPIGELNGKYYILPGQMTELLDDLK